MRARVRIRRLEQRVPIAGCAACTDRRGLMVLIDVGDPQPRPCEHCHEIAEQVIEIEEVIVTADDALGDTNTA